MTSLQLLHGVDFCNKFANYLAGKEFPCFEMSKVVNALRKA
jgi:hypothetical protein